MKRTREIFLVLTAAVLIGLPLGAPAQQSYTEDFTTTTYKDAVNTTADWNTADGELKLFPFVPTLAGNYDTAGNARSVAVAGDHAFVADDASGLQVIDISDPANPTLAGTYDTSGSARGVAVAGDYAFVADATAGLKVIDISDPTNPTLAGIYDTSGIARSVTVAGDHAFVADGGAGLQVIDISDPTNPTLAGAYDTPYGAYSIVVAGDHAFVADGLSGLQVIDISDPTNPTLAGTYDTPGSSFGIALAGDHAYIGDDSGGLQVIDISDPTTPTLAGTYATPSFALGVAVAGDRAFVTDYDDGLQVIDISDPTTPTLTFSCDTPGSAFGVAVAGDHAFVADYASGLQVIVVSEPITPTLAGSYNTPDWARGVAVSGDHAFVADFDSGLQVIDITDPTNPVLSGSYNTPSYAYDVVVSGDHAFVADFNSGLRVIDITDPTNPMLAGSYNTPSQAYDVAVSGDHAFVADGLSGLQVIDISDPTNPVFAGSFNTPGYAEGVVVSGDHVFVADYDGLQVIDISDPTNPVFAGSYDTSSGASGIAVAGNHAFIAKGSAGLQVIDISDPTSPSFAGSYNTPGEAYDVTVSGDHAIVADYIEGLRVIDITDPTSPVLVGSYNTPGQAWGVAVSGDHAFVADWGSGLRVIRVFESPSEFFTEGNTGQSLALDGATDTMVRARLSSTETAGVSWDLSADGGSSFQSFTPGAGWSPFAVPGTDLLWRSTHTVTEPGVNPTVSELTLDWLTVSGPINSVTDVPDDQGGWLRLSFARSGYDFADEADLPVTGYQVYRRVDDQAAAMRIIEEGDKPSTSEMAGTALVSFDPASIRILGERKFLVGGAKAQGELPPGTWEILNWVAARQADDYLVEAHTVADSTLGGGIHWSVFVTTTHTTTPSIWFASLPDSGYSVDNIAPGVPTGFAALYEIDGVDLDWDDALEDDFQFHRIYRGTSPEFEPVLENLVHETASSAWADETANPWDLYYKVTTLDHAGNESEAAAATVETGVDDGALPSVTALLGAYPNPFNPSTKLSFDLATPAHARLTIYDAAGRLVTTLVDESLASGHHEMVWNGRNDAGQLVASGVYLYRLEAGTTVQTQRMTLVK